MSRDAGRFSLGSMPYAMKGRYAPCEGAFFQGDKLTLVIIALKPASTIIARQLCCPN